MLHWSIHFKSRPVQAVLLLSLALAGYPQEPEDFEDLAGDRSALEEAPDIPVTMLEERTDRLNAPLNLNRATEEQLLESLLLTPYQVHHLLKYREAYGDLYSLYELCTLPGFSPSFVREIAGYFTVDPGMAALPGPPRVPRNIFMCNLGRVFPLPSGYAPGHETGGKPVYASGPLKFNFRFRCRASPKISFGLACDRDPGEPFFRQMRPEFVSGYVQYRDQNSLRDVVLGTFKLNQGLGLVNGSGFLHQLSGFRVNKGSMSALRPYASLNEDRYHQGIAVRLNMRRTDLLLWTSFRHMDLSLSGQAQGYPAADWLDLQRTGGLHRTPSEISGKSLAFHHHSGIQLLHQLGNLTVGAMAGMETAGLTKKGSDSLRIRSLPTQHTVLSVHWHWVHPVLETFGEVAISDVDALALLAGLRVRFSDFLRGLLLLHRYENGFRGILPSSYGSTSHIRNESGVSLHLDAEPGRLLRTAFTWGLYFYPAPRYLTDVPSLSFKSRWTLESTDRAMFRWKFQSDCKIWQRTPSTGSAGPCRLVTARRDKASLRLRYDPFPALQWQPRIIVSFLSEGKKHSTGYAACQQVRVQVSSGLYFTLRFLVFHVREWDNRIYLYEPGLYYDFSFPACYGEGRKINLVISLRAGKKLTVSGSFSLISYTDRDEIGTGNERTEGPHKWDAGIQLRLRF